MQLLSNTTWWLVSYLKGSVVYFTSEVACIGYFWFTYDLGQKYQAPQVRPDRDSNSWPPDHDSTLHVTETSALTTRPSVTSVQTQLCRNIGYLMNCSYMSFRGLCMVFNCACKEISITWSRSLFLYQWQTYHRWCQTVQTVITILRDKNQLVICTCCLLCQVLSMIANWSIYKPCNCVWCNWV